jgi:hypothetical protein
MSNEGALAIQDEHADVQIGIDVNRRTLLEQLGLISTDTTPFTCPSRTTGAAAVMPRAPLRGSRASSLKAKSLPCRPLLKNARLPRSVLVAPACSLQISAPFVSDRRRLSIQPCSAL